MLNVTKLANHVIEAKIIAGKNIENWIYIPRMLKEFPIASSMESMLLL